VPHENYQMTLAFVGAVAASQLARHAESWCRAKGARFSLTFDECEYWPKPESSWLVARLVLPSCSGCGGTASRTRRVRVGT